MKICFDALVTCALHHVDGETESFFVATSRSIHSLPDSKVANLIAINPNVHFRTKTLSPDVLGKPLF
jgi:hypothetical protein